MDYRWYDEDKAAYLKYVVERAQMTADTGERLREGDDLAKAGVKYDKNKLPMHLVAWDCIRRLARILQVGAKKYAPRNWETGMAWSRPYDAAMRHLTDWWNGEDLDPDSGENHLDHAFCNIMFLMRYARSCPELDDRPKPPINAKPYYGAGAGRQAGFTSALEKREEPDDTSFPF